jgi:prophage regulatory protein
MFVRVVEPIDNKEFEMFEINSLRLIKIREVMAVTGMSRTAIYKGIKDGTFPPQIALTKRSVGWLSLDVYAWIVARIEASRPWCG